MSKLKAKIDISSSRCTRLSFACSSKVLEKSFMHAYNLFEMHLKFDWQFGSNYKSGNAKIIVHVDVYSC